MADLQQTLANEIDKLIEQLDDNNINVREQAQQRLIEIGRGLQETPLLGFVLGAWFLKYLKGKLAAAAAPEPKARLELILKALTADETRRLIGELRKVANRLEEQIRLGEKVIDPDDREGRRALQLLRQKHRRLFDRIEELERTLD